MTAKLSIQKALLELARAGAFYAVTYSNGIPADFDPKTATKVAPVSGTCNELSSSFASDPRYGRSMALRRQAWTFQMRLSFAQEVTGEAFERALMQSPPLVKIDDAGTRPVLLQKSSWTHPVSGQPATGSQVTFEFIVPFDRV